MNFWLFLILVAAAFSKFPGVPGKGFFGLAAVLMALAGVAFSSDPNAIYWYSATLLIGFFGGAAIQGIIRKIGYVGFVGALLLVWFVVNNDEYGMTSLAAVAGALIGIRYIIGKAFPSLGGFVFAPLTMGREKKKKKVEED